MENRPLIMLVEDEKAISDFLSAKLTANNYRLLTAPSGREAVSLAASHCPDLVLLDLGLPDIDGMEVLRRVKETQPDIEVIILTGHGNETDRETCMNMGAFAYLQKPVDIDILSETMKAANEKIQERRQQRGA